MKKNNIVMKWLIWASVPLFLSGLYFINLKVNNPSKNTPTQIKITYEIPEADIHPIKNCPVGIVQDQDASFAGVNNDNWLTSKNITICIP